MSAKDINSKIGKTVTEGYRKIEEGAVNAYKKVEEGAVNAYRKVEDACIDALFSRFGETTEETRERLKKGGEAKNEKE